MLCISCAFSPTFSSNFIFCLPLLGFRFTQYWFGGMVCELQWIISFIVDTWFSQHCILVRLSFPHCSAVSVLSQIEHQYVWEFSPLLGPLLCPIYLFIYLGTNTILHWLWEHYTISWQLRRHSLPLVHIFQECLGLFSVFWFLYKI